MLAGAGGRPGRSRRGADHPAHACVAVDGRPRRRGWNRICPVL